MPRQLIEALTGLGAIYSNDYLLRADVPYQISLWSGDGPPDGDNSNEATTIDGTLVIEGMGEAVVLTSLENLTLKLGDGRRLAFTLTSTGGKIVARGGFQSA
jgi:hypothetical protein